MAIGDVQRIGGGGASNFNAILSNRSVAPEVTPRESLSSSDQQRRLGSADQADQRTQNINSRIEKIINKIRFILYDIKRLRVRQSVCLTQNL